MPAGVADRYRKFTIHEISNFSIFLDFFFDFFPSILFLLFWVQDFLVPDFGPRSVPDQTLFLPIFFSIMYLLPLGGLPFFYFFYLLNMITF